MSLFLNKMKIRLKQGHKEDVITVNKMNYDFLKRITSHSFFSWHELYYIHANKYCTCLQIHGFPKESQKNFLGSLTDDKEIYVTIDCEHMTKFDFDTTFNRIVKRNDEDSNDTKNLRTSKKKIEEIREINAFDSYLTHTNEEVKTITVRVYIECMTLEELQKKLNNVIDILISKKMKGYIQTNDIENDVRALTDVSNPIKKMVSSSTVADILLKSEISHVEKYGSLIGYTANGVYCPDLFSFKNSSYDYIAIGGKGAGKSALVKVLEEGYLCFGNHILHIFDIHGEYKEFAKMNGISIVSMNDKNTVNLCQIFYTLNMDGLITEIDITSKIAVLTETFKSSAEEKRKNVIDHFEKELKDFYIQNVLNKNIYELSNDDWFTLGDVVKFIQDKYHRREYEDIEMKDIYCLTLSLGNMLSKYGFIYSQKTNMDFDLTQSILYDISFIESVKDSKVKNAYVSLLMDYESMAVRINLERNEAEMKKNGVYASELKRPYYTFRLLIDETLEYASDRGFMLKTIHLINYARKAYAGCGFIIHTIDDTRRKIHDGINDDESYLGQLFSSCTNKFVGKTDGASLNDLPLIVKSMNEHDVKIVSSFKKGIHGERQFLIVDDHNRKFYITTIVNKFQQKYFGGGA